MAKRRRIQAKNSCPYLVADMAGGSGQKIISCYSIFVRRLAQYWDLDSCPEDCEVPEDEGYSQISEFSIQYGPSSLHLHGRFSEFISP